MWVSFVSCYHNLYIADEQNNRIRKVTFYTACFPAAINNVTTNNTITISPNPAYNEVTIAGATINTVQLINMLGQVVYAKEYNTQKATIDISLLPAGIYFVRVNN